MNKLALRNAWFQVHKWIGLILAVLLIPLSLTGALLVWDEAVDHAINPARYAVSGTAGTDPARYLAAARGALEPGVTVTTLALPRGGAPAIVTAARPGARAVGGPAPRFNVYLDPPTARVLGVGDTGTGLLRVAHMLHGNLLLPGIGRPIVGTLGVAMLLSSATGLWLWWPRVGKLSRGLRWKRHPNLDHNLHQTFGFWIALPLFVLSLTGIWISFPQVFGASMAMAGRGGRPVPLATTRLDLDTVISSAQAAVPGEVAQVEWPTNKAPAWKVTLTGGESVSVADASGVVVPTPAEREPLGRLMRRIHDGTRMGLAWQIVIFLGGLIPAGLAVTGIIMWARARKWRARVKARAVEARLT